MLDANKINGHRTVNFLIRAGGLKLAANSTTKNTVICCMTAHVLDIIINCYSGEDTEGAILGAFISCVITAIKALVNEKYSKRFN